jgi:hypothetical protein
MPLEILNLQLYAEGELREYADFEESFPAAFIAGEESIVKLQ